MGHFHSESELIRFVDPMKEAIIRNIDESDVFFRQYSLRTRFTSDESDKMRKIREEAADFAEARFGKRIKPIKSIISAVGLFRVIAAIQKSVGDRKLRILEVGPGSGYLGAFLIDEGHQYVGVDTTPAFYLWQSAFFHHFGRDDYSEFAHIPLGAKLEYSQVTHLPWWHFVNEVLTGQPFEFDIVICEQAISEMHAWASRFTAQASFNALKNSDVRMLVFSDYGHPTVSAEEIEGMLGELQFSKVLSNLVHAYTPGPHKLPPKIYSLDKEIPFYNPSGDKTLLSATDILKTKKEELPLDLEFLRFLGIWKNYEKYVVEE